ncbi:hypothetical protein SCHPADRAFT_945490 [Schizopora paradoxa]|uniref:Uncharacterized protein n=1 Tax=Schizopora paradoxa TaxID=27342 RepID=A0A0H2R746_9AGAM|nr:hypothetical protein SCHPADRAFT_945490 [Schizopora paradoxa]
MNVDFGILPLGCPPSLNVDVSGVEIRVSFYAQAFLLALLCIRSGSSDEISGSLSTLIGTNIIMVITSLILGFREDPEMTLQDGLIVLYLLSISWIAICVAMTTFNRFKDHNQKLSYLSIFQSYLVFAFAIALLAKWKNFGSTPECNSEVVVFIFRIFNAIHVGRKAGWAVVITALVLYTGMMIVGYPRTIRSAIAKVRSSGSMTGGNLEEGKRNRICEPDLEFSGRIVLQIIFIVILLPLAIVNTELLVKRNRSAPESHSQEQWAFGQVIPVFLIAHPLVKVLSAFKKYGLRSRKYFAMKNMNSKSDVADGSQIKF